MKKMHKQTERKEAESHKNDKGIYFSPEELSCLGKFSKELFVNNPKVTQVKLIESFVEACAQLGIDAKDILDEDELVSEIIQAYKNTDGL